MSKQPITRKLALLCGALFAVPLFTAPAHAYIDPGTVSIVLQSIIGGVAAAGLFFRSHILVLYYKIFPGRAKTSDSETLGDHANDAR